MQSSLKMWSAVALASMASWQVWAADAAVSQTERERIVRALIEGDGAATHANSFQDTPLPATPPSTPNMDAPAYQQPASPSAPVVPVSNAMKANSFEVQRRDAEAVVGIALAQQGASELVEADIIKPVQNVLYRYDKPLKIDVKTLQFDVQTHTWSANILLNDEMGNVITALPASGRWQEMVSVPSLKSTVRAGEVIKDEDIVMMAYPKARLHDDNVVDASQLVGNTPRRSISNNRPIRTTEVQKPYVVQKGATVTMRYSTPAMSITAVGQTLQAGGMGETIRVKNIDSNAIVTAVVISSNEVQIGGPDGKNTNAQAIILSPAEANKMQRRPQNEPLPVPRAPLSASMPAAPAPAPMPSDVAAPAAPLVPQEAIPAQPPAVSPVVTPPAVQNLPEGTAKTAEATAAPQSIPTQQNITHTSSATTNSADQKREMQERLVKKVFMDEEGLTPEKSLESLNPDDMILAPKKMISSPELPELDPTKSNTNPFARMNTP